MGRVIVTREKNDDQILDASTPEAWAASSLALLTERWKSGDYYYEPEEMYGNVESAIAETEALLKVASSAHMTDELNRRLERQRQQAKEVTRYSAWYELAKRVVEEQDDSVSPGIRIGTSSLAIPAGWPLAWGLLYHRRDAEYEGVTLKEMRG